MVSMLLRPFVTHPSQAKNDMRIIIAHLIPPFQQRFLWHRPDRNRWGRRLQVELLHGGQHLRFRAMYVMRVIYFNCKI